ncbi:MAG: hypothetical protein [Podoviridae sp. ctda_1]|nr:MAG: hypothetical protein [Podoviridae sp. ctda_1]
MATSKKATKKTAAKKKPIKVSAAQARKAMKGANVIQPPKKRAYKRKPKDLPNIETNEHLTAGVALESPATPVEQGAQEEAGSNLFGRTISNDEVQGIIHRAEQNALFNNAEFVTIDGLSTAAKLAFINWMIEHGCKYINSKHTLSDVDNPEFIAGLLNEHIGAVKILGNGVVDIVGIRNVELLESKKVVSLEGISIAICTDMKWVGQHAPNEIEHSGAHYVRVK